MKNKNVPIKKNEVYEMDILAVGSEGQGIGRINNFTVFVPFTLMGEKIRVKIIKIKSSYAYGKLLEILEISKERREPFCKVYNRCGGCMLQHISYKEQLEQKTNRVKDALIKIGKFDDIKINEIIGAENQKYYRNKGQYPVGMDKSNNEVIVGFYAPRSHTIIEHEICYLQDQSSQKIINSVKNWMKRYNVKPYNEERKNGVVRHIYIRIGSKTDEIMVAIVANSKKIPYSNELIDILRQSDKRIVSIIHNINMENTNVILGEENITIWGQEYIHEKIGNLVFNISPHSFFQVNSEQTQKMYDKVLEYAQLSGEETVFDLYCGIGTISLFLAQKAKKVIGVEIVEEAVKDAYKNMELNKMNNLQFYAGKAEEVVSELYEKGIKGDIVVVDPPRKGCDETLLKTIVEMKPKKLIYVSCNPATLARDLKILRQFNFEVKEVQPIDMFPYTSHVETVVLMSRVKEKV